MAMTIEERAKTLEAKLLHLYGIQVTQPNVHIAAEALGSIEDAIREAVEAERTRCADIAAGWSGPVSDRLQEIRERAANATPGPLSYGSVTDESDTWVFGSQGLLWGRIVGSPGRCAQADAAFFVHAREDIPFLLAEIDRLKAALAEVTTQGSRQWEPVENLDALKERGTW